RNEEDIDGPGLPRSGRAREFASATFGWLPADLPSAKVQYFRTDLFDRMRRFEDTSENRLHRVTHAGRVTYDDTWWDDRVTLSSDYNVQRRRIDTRTEGSGEVEFPVAPFGGISALDDTPEQGALDPNPALIDSNLTVGAGLNIGLPPVGADGRPRNAGLD